MEAEESIFITEIKEGIYFKNEKSHVIGVIRNVTESYGVLVETLRNCGGGAILHEQFFKSPTSEYFKNCRRIYNTAMVEQSFEYFASLLYRIEDLK